MSDTLRMAAAVLVTVVSGVTTGCTTSSAALYPLQWPAIATQPEVRCAVEGEYENVGVVAHDGPTRFPTTSWLDTLLRPDSGGSTEPPRAGRVRLSLEPGALLIDTRDVASAAILRVAGGRDACERDGAYVLRFSERYDSENGAGDLHRTQSIVAASDGSLIMKSILYFDGSRSVFRSKHERLVWYRFTRAE